jgi:hypothetical protein
LYWQDITTQSQQGGPTTSNIINHSKLCAFLKEN